MISYTQTILLFLSALFVSCNARNTLPELNSNKQENKAEVSPINTKKSGKRTAVPETDEVPSELAELYDAFYDKFCLGHASPRPILNPDGIYVLDLETYKNNLSVLNIFTHSFIDKQDLLFSECKKVLEKDSITPQDVPDGIDASAPLECGFFQYNYYLNSQERPDGYYLRNSKWNAQSGFGEVHFYTAVEDSFFTWDHQIILYVHFTKVRESWMISDVQKRDLQN